MTMVQRIFTLIGLSCMWLSAANSHADQAYVLVLGVAQDAGYPQAGTKTSPAWADHSLRRKAACLGIVDPDSGRRWMLEATPDFKDQLYLLDQAAPHPDRPGLAGIFLTHGHMGHYSGLIHLGREAIGAQSVPVYAMPRMKHFLETNGPWELLVRLKNIKIVSLAADKPVRLNSKVSIRPFVVPHRDEYTETVGFEITGPKKKVLFIPDIDKWEKLDKQGLKIEDLVDRVDVAFIDGTFFADGEIPGRAMSEIPHPFMAETMRRFDKRSKSFKSKIHFIHLNRTNPALQTQSNAAKTIRKNGFDLAQPLQRVGL
jgi:pyrroloquinoline quinone biosynthesis protein B